METKVSKTCARILEYVLNNGPTSAADIESKIGIDASRATKLFKRCEARGLLEGSDAIRFARGRPRRYYRLTLKGESIFQDVLSSYKAKNRVEVEAA